MPRIRSLRALRAVLGGLALITAGTALVMPFHRARAANGDSVTLALLPYTIGDSDLPAGWTVYGTTATTNAAVAFAAGADGAQTLQALEDAGRVTGLQQTIAAPRGRGIPPIQVVIELYRDETAAAAAFAALSAPSGATIVPDFAAPDIANAWAQHTVISSDDGPLDSYTVAWTNGSLLLGVTSSGAATDTQTLLGIAQTVAGRAGDPPPSAPDSAGDAQELAVAQAMDTAQLPATAAPGGFARGGAYVWSDAQLALDSRAPADTAREVVASWGRVTGEAQFFLSDDGTRTTLTTGYALFHDAAGASTALHDLTLYSASRQAVLPQSPPLQLGDDTVALRTVVLWPGGELRDGYVLEWQHGAVLLSVTIIAPANSTAPAYLTTVAQAFDAAYRGAAPFAS